MEMIAAAVSIGIGATLLLDLWGVFLNVAFGVPLSDYATVGRWLGYMPAGRFVHASIRAAPPVQGERIIGWIAHYATGIVFAALLVVICGEDWLRHPSLVPALLLGIITVAAPFLLMQPGMGLGIASSRAPNPSAARLRSSPPTPHSVSAFSSPHGFWHG
ncbi:MAG: DUF2938 domain-containing protein [Bauldia sp.]